MHLNSGASGGFAPWAPTRALPIGGPIGGLKAAHKLHALEKKIHAPPNQNSWIRPWTAPLSESSVVQQLHCPTAL